MERGWQRRPLGIPSVALLALIALLISSTADGPRATKQGCNDLTLSLFFTASRFSAKVPYLTVPKVASCRILHSSPSIPSLFRLPNTVEDLIDSVTASVLSQLQRRAPAKKLLRANLEDRRSQHQPAPLAKGGTSGAPQKAGTNPSISQSVRRGNKGGPGGQTQPVQKYERKCARLQRSNDGSIRTQQQQQQPQSGETTSRSCQFILFSSSWQQSVRTSSAINRLHFLFYLPTTIRRGSSTRRNQLPRRREIASRCCGPPVLCATDHLLCHRTICRLP